MAYRMIPERIAKTMINSLDERKIQITHDGCAVCPQCDMVPPWWNPCGCSECGYKLGNLKPIKSRKGRRK